MSTFDPASFFIGFAFVIFAAAGCLWARRYAARQRVRGQYLAARKVTHQFAQGGHVGSHPAGPWGPTYIKPGTGRDAPHVCAFPKPCAHELAEQRRRETAARIKGAS